MAHSGCSLNPRRRLLPSSTARADQTDGCAGGVRDSMRTGQEYRDALRDGRKILIVGEGLIDDVTTHPATRAMVDAYAAWYDRHHDPEWAEVVLAPPNATTGARVPWGTVVPTSAEDLTAMGR